MFLIKTHTQKVRDRAAKKLEEYSRPSVDFFLLIALSAAIATIGVILNNTAILIGAMLVAPLITPVFWFSFALIVLKVKSVFRAILAIVMGSIVAIIVSSISSYLIFYSNLQEINFGLSTLFSYEPNTLLFAVALLSGMAGAYAYTKPDRKSSLPGVAISVTVIPPLCVAGIGITLAEWNIFYNGATLYFSNLIGIIFGSLLIFIFEGFGEDTQKIEIKK